MSRVSNSHDDHSKKSCLGSFMGFQTGVVEEKSCLGSFMGFQTGVVEEQASA